MRSILLPFAIATLLAQTPSVDLPSIRADLDTLCSPKLEGRASLSPGADLAARYIAESFRKSGLDTALQTFQLLAPASAARDQITVTVIQAGARRQLRPGHDYRGGIWSALQQKAPVVFVGYGITAPEYHYDDYAGIDVKGKIVLAFEHEPQETDPHSIFNGTGHTRHANAHAKSDNARRHGALALLLVSEPLRKHPSLFDPPTLPANPPSLRATAPRQTLDDHPFPVLTLSDQAAADILRPTGHTPAELQASIDRQLKPASQPLPNATIEITSPAPDLRRGQSANVIASLPGSDPKLRAETILITAHYDHLGVQNGHLYPGANDNASGTVAVMELARLFAHAATRPKRTLLFIVFGSEEEGLLGSYYYVSHPLRPLVSTRAVLNLDMIARDEAEIPQSKGVLEISPDTHNQINLVGAFYSPDLEAQIRQANQQVGLDLSTKHDRDHNLNTLFRCDHFPFLLHDVPAVWFFGGFHPGYHEPSDTVDQLNFSKLEKVVRLTWLTARSLGDATSVPRFQH